MRFASPGFLLLLLVLPVIWWYHRKIILKKSGRMTFPSLDAVRKLPESQAVRLRRLRPFFRIAAVAMFILALARPQAGQRTEEVSSSGIDIMLCLDTSSSMLAEDFKPQNRLDAAKAAAKDFVKGRKHDRIGIVVFSELSFTQCPLTLDYGAVLDFLEGVEVGMTQTDGTAIGDALATCVNRLKDSAAKSKIIILLTDGCNNRGQIDPVTAANAAAAFNIKIYSIGTGAPGPAMRPVDNPVFGRQYVQIPDELDENTLINIASATGGQYFRATSSKKLKEIYEKIDSMEKTDIKVSEYTEYTELFPWFMFPAVILLLAEIILFNTVLGKIP